MVKVEAVLRQDDKPAVFRLDKGRMVEDVLHHQWYVYADEVRRVLKGKTSDIVVKYDTSYAYTGGSAVAAVSNLFPVKFAADGSITVGRRDCHTFPASQVAIIRKWAFGKKSAKKKGRR